MEASETVFDAARRLERSGTPYALVSVIRALAPASARPGDKAIVTADGSMHGWVGGGCAQPVVVRAVRQVLSDGHARLIRIAPTTEDAQRDLGDTLEFGMACHSGGTLEMFVDPVLPRARLVVIGGSPVVHGLVRLAPCVGFAVTVVAPGLDPALFAGAEQVLADDAPEAVQPHVAPGAWIVVATQGRRDVQGLRLALALQARQVSFVASARKAQVLKSALLAAGSDAQAVAAIIAPAGYPMAATTPEEIALSVLAAVVSDRRRAHAPALPEDAALEAPPGPAVAVAAPHACCAEPADAAVAPGPAAPQSCCAEAAEAAPAPVHPCCGD
jgi:xanthine dehydrogenase accessory factor